MIGLDHHNVVLGAWVRCQDLRLETSGSGGAQPAVEIGVEVQVVVELDVVESDDG